MVLKHSSQLLFRTISWHLEHQHLSRLHRFFPLRTKRHFHGTSYLSAISETEAKRRSQQKAWNEAASVLIVAPMNNSEPYCLGYLMLERSRTGRVMPGNWVFPGGNVDPSDSDSKWIDLFKEILNIDITQEKFLQNSAHQPEIYQLDNSNEIPKEVSLRITAVREAFEEAGVLLCRPKKLDPTNLLHNGKLHYEFKQLEDKKILQDWQKRVRKNGQQFIELCRELEVAPDIRSLHDWSNWLTPTVFKPKSRFDTMYYMIILPKMAKVVIDGNEAVTAQWISPEKAISEHGKGDLRLMPPQIYEFTRLASLKKISDLQQRIRIRREQGIERYFPVIRNLKDGTIYLLPGDDLYPVSPDYLQMDPESLKEFPNTIAELKASSVNFHRGIANSDGAITKYEINVARYGNIY